MTNEKEIDSKTLEIMIKRLENIAYYGELKQIGYNEDLKQIIDTMKLWKNRNLKEYNEIDKLTDIIHFLITSEYPFIRYDQDMKPHLIVSTQRELIDSIISVAFGLRQRIEYKWRN